MSAYKATQTKQYAKSGPRLSQDALYWKNIEFPITIKEYSSIDYIDVSSQEPHYIAVTAGLKVDIYHQQTAQVWKSMSRFQTKAYGGTFRQDGQLLVAGAENGQIMLFNYRLKQLLRIFKGHSGPVHRTKFIPSQSHVVSFSDDKSVVLWDITDEKKLSIMEGHTDFVRAGCVNPASDNLVLSGSYDHTVKLWDTRIGKSTLSVDHGSPVESILCYPSGSVFVSAGGTEICVWDMVSKKLVSRVSQHHKAITCLALASDNRRLVSGSLDRHVKFYDVDTYSVVHSMDYIAPVLSLAVAPKDSTIAVGMISSGSGLLSIQHRKDSNRNNQTLSKRKAADIRNTPAENINVAPGDEVIEHVDKDKLAVYDQKLRKFEYSRALDSVLKKYTFNRSPHIVVAVLKELSRRNGLRSALAGRNNKSLTVILRFLTKHIRDPRFKIVLLDVTEHLLDIYSDSIHDRPGLFGMLKKILLEVNAEIENANENVAMMGLIEMFLASSEVQPSCEATPMTLETIDRRPNINNIQRSKNKNSVIAVT